jgi:hypothetical protein
MSMELRENGVGRDKILKRDGASSSHTHDDVIFLVPCVVEHQCEVMDLVLALTKKKKGL